jgi:hypothetical protein
MNASDIHYQGNVMNVKFVVVDGVKYLKAEDVAELLMELGATEETDVRTRIEELSVSLTSNKKLDNNNKEKHRVGVAPTLENYKSLHKEYEKAFGEFREGNYIIRWNGLEFVMSYLYYFLQYLDTFYPEIKEYAEKHKIKRTKTM